MTITTKDVAWAAGFLEGEGSFTNDGSLRIWACQNEPEPLERLHRIFGGSVYPAGTLRSNPKIGRWALFGNKGAAVMMTLYCLMSPKRQFEIERSLARWKRQPGNGGYRPAGKVWNPRLMLWEEAMPKKTKQQVGV